MLRRQVIVHASLRDVLPVLREAAFVSAESTSDDHGLLHMEDGLGMLRDLGGSTRIDVVDADEGVHVARVVNALRGIGLVVEHTQLGPQP